MYLGADLKNKIKILLFFFVVIGFFKVHASDNIHQAEVVEHLGKKLPLDLTFRNSVGDKVLLKDLVNKPTIFDFVYYRCTGICTPLMVEVASVIGKMDLQPGKDYRIISISINPAETPKIAAQKKNAMLSVIGKKIPPASWEFLTGDSVSIAKITDAAGFYFQKQGNGYLHKGVLIFVDKNGKICEYVHPGYTSRGDFTILPSEFKMAVIETGKGAVTATIQKVLQTCTTFISKGKDGLILVLIMITGIFTITAVLVIIKKANPYKGNS